MLSFPFRTEQGALAQSSGATSIMERIALLIGTPAGSRSLVPEYGCPVPPDLPADVPLFNEELLTAIQTFIPDARQVSLVTQLDGDQVIVNVTFYVLHEQVSHDFILDL